MSVEELTSKFRATYGREPNAEERAAILLRVFHETYGRDPDEGEAKAIQQRAGGAGEAPPARSPVVENAPAEITTEEGETRRPTMTVDPDTGQPVADFGTITVKPHRKLYSGGAFQDTLDFLSSGSRASAAFVGSLLRPEGGSYLERYRNPDTSYGALLDEAFPNADDTWYGRLGTGIAGFVGDVALDPTTYVAIGALGKLGKVAKAGEEVSGLARGAARAGMAALDPIGEVVAPTVKAGAKAALKVPGVGPAIDRAVVQPAGRVLTNVADRAAARNAVREILREERRAVGAKALRTGETALALKDTAQAVAARAERATPEQVRAGIGQVLDSGYDAARAAEKGAVSEQARALKQARRELTIPARAKAARSEGRLAATRQAADGADALLSRTQAGIEKARGELDELTRKRGELAGRLKGLTERKLGRMEGKRGGTVSRQIAEYGEASDALIASDARMEALERQIREQEEILGRTRVQRQNVRAENEAIAAERQARTDAAVEGMGEDAWWNAVHEMGTLRLAEDDPTSGVSVARRILGSRYERPAFVPIDRQGRAGKNAVESVSLQDLSESEARAFRDFLDEYLPAGEGKYGTADVNGRLKANPTIIQQGEHGQYDVAMPKAELDRALSNYNRSITGREAELREMVEGGPRIPSASAPGVNQEAEPAARTARELRREYVAEQGRNRALRTDFKKRHSGLAADFKRLGMEGTEADRLLKEHGRLTTRVTETTGRLRELNRAAASQGREAARLATRAEKLAPVVEARKAAAKAARDTLTSPEAKAARRAEVAAAGEAAKAPAMEGAVANLRESLGLSPEGEGLLRGALGRVQEAGNESGAQLAQAGVLSPSTVAGNRDVYAKRIYEKTVDRDAYLQGLRDDPMAFLRQEAEQAGAFRGSGGGTNPVGAMAKRRKDLGLETREGLGQIPDILPRFLRGESESGAAVARQNTLNALAERLAVPELSEEAAAASVAQAPTGTLGRVGDFLGLTPNRMVQVPDQAKYGPLRGQYVPHEALQTFDRSIAPFRFTHSNPMMDTGLRYYDKALSTWKAAKVPFNPPTRIANRVANWARAYAEEGIDPLTYIRYASGAAKDIRGEGALASGWHGLQRVMGKEVPRGEPGLPYRLAVETDPVFEAGLMGPGYDEALRMAAGEKPGLFGAIRRGLDYIGHGYSKAETTDKLGLFKLFMDRGDAPGVAADKVRRTLFDYSEAPYGAELLSKTGVMPFARYPFLALPAEAAAFRARPDRYATAAKGLLALQREGDDDQGTRGYEEQTMTGYQRNNAALRLPWQDGAGRSQYADITRYLPAGALLDTGEAMRSINPLTGNPFLSLGVSLTSNRDTFTGQDLAAEDLPDGYRAGQLAGHVAEDLLPSVAPGGIYWNQAARALRGDMDGEGMRYPLWPSLLRYGTGLTLRPVTAGRNLGLRDMELQRRANAWGTEISRAARRGQDTAGLEAAAQADMDRAMERNALEVAR